MPKKVLLLLLGAFLIRLIVAPFFGHPWDMSIWTTVGSQTVEQHTNVYEVHEVDYPWGSYTYPPVWLGWCATAYILTRPLQNLEAYVAAIKLLPILADIAVGVLIWKIMTNGQGQKDNKKALLAMSFWVFNPVSFYISAVWGMFDSLAIFFALLGLYYFWNGRYSCAGFFLGVGAAVKIFPSLLLMATIPLLVRRVQLRLSKVLWRHILPFISFPLFVSIPYLGDPLAYLNALLKHFGQVGQFTYWVFLSSIVNSQILGTVATAIMLLIVFISYRRANKMFEDPHNGIYLLSFLIILAFFATSTKVNVQYVTWVLPLVIIDYFQRGDVKMKRFFVTLVIAAMGWIAVTLPLLNFFSLDMIGKVSEPRHQFFGVIGAAAILFALYWTGGVMSALSRFMGVRRQILSRRGKILAVFLLATLLVFVIVYPTPSGVVLPYRRIRVGVSESLDSAFRSEPKYDVDAFQSMYNLTHIVLPLGPDFVNTYSGFNSSASISKYFRYKLGAYEWTQEDLLSLTRTLHNSEYQVVLGIFLQPKMVNVHLGFQGYESDWLLNRHPEVFNETGQIAFDTALEDDHDYGIIMGEIYGDYFADRMLQIVDDFKMDGVCLMDWSDSSSTASAGAFNSITRLLSAVSLRFKESGKLLLVEDAGDIQPHDQYQTMIRLTDYLVLKTSPWISSVFYMKQNRTLWDYASYVNQILRATPPDLRGKLLFAIYTQDFSRGWLTPAAVLQHEVNEFSVSLPGGGYVIYHTNKYLPYRLTVSHISTPS